MTEEQIQFLDREGFDIYSHTLNHSRLTQCNSKTIKNELELSKLTLERILGHAVNYISYPHGEYDSCTLEYTAKAGYTKGFTITPCNVENCNRQNNNLEIPRFRVTPDTGCFIFSLICSGSFGIIGKINCIKRNFSTKVARFFQAYV
jgi:peptidoglycan/xylan/chitin deacetylase (PgdA/CDA1 family)